ncbi:MAG: beta-galactosidase trimerization domain-containing protein [Clostridiaceae bacterium]|nr:beta-galactosidase trimerization domain-containing protein [Clostridiaceae bacterium]
MPWWDNTPLLISAIGSDTTDETIRILHEHTVPRAFDAEQRGDALSIVEFDQNLGGDEDFRRCLSESRRAGIREIIYINTHCFGYRSYETHSDWAEVGRDGKAFHAYDVNYYTCLNSPWRQEFFRTLRRVASFDIDGIFLDGPIMLRDGCFCPACQEKFRTAYGRSLFDATDDERMRFNTDVVTDFLRETYETLKSINPELLLYINNSALRADVTGSNTRRCAPYTDMLGAEGGFCWVNPRFPLWHVSPMAKILESQAGGKPTIIFTAGDHKPWSHFAHTAAETRIFYWQSVANGAGVWYTMHGGEYMMETEGGRAAVDCNRFIRAHRDLYAHTKPVSRVALLWSQDSANYYSSSVERTDFTAAVTLGKDASAVKGNHYNALMGFYEALTRSHVQFDIIDEANVTEGWLSRYDTLIAPTAGCMSDAVADGIRAFVKTGGTFVSTFDTGFYNADGTPCAPKLADVQGFSKVSRVVLYPNAGTGYARIGADSPVTANMSCKLIPTPDRALDVVPITGVRVSMEFLEPMGGRYEPLTDKAYPAILENDYGKGKSVFFTGTVGEFFHEMTLPDYRRLFINAVTERADPVIRSNAPGSVEMVLRERDGKYRLHLINLTGEMGRPFENILPLHDVSVELSVGHPLKDARCVTNAKVCDFETIKDGCRFALPIIYDYELLTIE